MFSSLLLYYHCYYNDGHYNYLYFFFTIAILVLHNLVYVISIIVHTISIITPPFHNCYYGYRYYNSIIITPAIHYG